MNATDVKNYRATVAFMLSEARELSLEGVGQVLREPSKDKVRSLIARGKKLVVNGSAPGQEDAA